MLYTGEYYNKLGQLISINIVIGGESELIRGLNSDDTGVYFAPEACTIESNTNDTFDVIQSRSATLGFLTKSYNSDFYSSQYTDAVVSVYRDSECIFLGYIEPQTYSQSFSGSLDELSVECFDFLASLQYIKYKQVGQGVEYSDAVSDAGLRSFMDIITEILSPPDDLNSSTLRIWYDGSVKLDGGATFGIFDEVGISDLLFLGEDEEDVWTQEEVLTEILKYLNLHITQIGRQFYIYSWESMRSGSEVNWYDLLNGMLTKTGDTVAISVDNVADDECTISLGETFNKITLTCDLESIDSLISSPLDDDDLYTNYSGREHLLTEFAAVKGGSSAVSAYVQMVKNGYHTISSYGDGTMTKWYMLPKLSANWVFNLSADTDGTTGEAIAEGEDMHLLLDALAAGPGAAIISSGSVETNGYTSDYTPTGTINMTDSLFISVNGNEDDDDPYPADSDLLAAAPVAEYTGTSAGIYSPVDEDTINYIVLSGSIILNPVTDADEQTFVLADGAASSAAGSYREGDKDGDRYYGRRYYADGEERGLTDGFCPYTGEFAESYEFNYSAIGSSEDTISKLSVLACMLVIGDKVCIESGTDGQPDDFTWETYKTLDECLEEYDDEDDAYDAYYSQCIYIGFNPTIGDNLIGVKFDFQNNVDTDMNIDTEGIAIPMKHSDKLTGVVQFKILGAVNCMWDEITRRHKTWFRSTKWTSNSIPLMAHVSSIQLDDFEVKVVSDNGGSSYEDDDAELCYISDTDETYTNEKDDIEFKICTALTTTERTALGLASGVYLSTPYEVSTEEVFTEVYNSVTGESAKPEQMYVDAYYNEYHEPKIEMEINLLDDGTLSPFTLFTHPALSDRTFYVVGMGWSLDDGSATLNLKEI